MSMKFREFILPQLKIVLKEYRIQKKIQYYSSFGQIVSTIEINEVLFQKRHSEFTVNLKDAVT